VAEVQGVKNMPKVVTQQRWTNSQTYNLSIALMFHCSTQQITRQNKQTTH